MRHRLGMLRHRWLDAGMSRSRTGGDGRPGARCAALVLHTKSAAGGCRCALIATAHARSRLVNIDKLRSHKEVSGWATRLDVHVP